MADASTLKDLDRRIILALQVNARASWTQVAAALEHPVSTVARRGRALLDNRDVVVVGLLDHLRVGTGVSHHLHLRVRPGRAPNLARRMVADPRVRFVAISGGGSELLVEVVAPDHKTVDPENTLTEEDIIDWTSGQTIRKFSAYEYWVPGIFDDAQLALLRDGLPAVSSDRDWRSRETLTHRELALAAALSQDGRASHRDIAQRIGVTEVTAASMIESLVARGCLRFRAVHSPGALGDDTEFTLFMTVKPSRAEEAGKYLAANPATRMVALLTGSRNLLAVGALRDFGDLYTFCTEVVGKTPGLQSSDLAIVARTFKRAWIPIDADGRAELELWRVPQHIESATPHGTSIRPKPLEAANSAHR